MKIHTVSPAVLGLTLLSGCSAQESEPTSRSTDQRPTTTRRSVDHSALDRILRDNIRNGRVDYLNIRKRHWRGLNDYLERLTKANLGQGSRQEHLAALINLYNATMIKAVIERLHVDYSVAEKEFSVFKEGLVRTREGTVSLNHLENEIIRKQFKEPSIHVALVCGAESCPPLLRRAYVAKDLDKVLENNMRAFANDVNRNRIDTSNGKLQLSQVFNWYAQDFGGQSALRGYLQKYVNQDLSGLQVSFLDYSWKLNLARPKSGQWVQTLGDKTPMYRHRKGGAPLKRVRKGSIFEFVFDDRERVQVEDALGAGKLWVDRLAVVPF
jgi:hypothetical protein